MSKNHGIFELSLISNHFEYHLMIYEDIPPSLVMNLYPENWKFSHYYGGKRNRRAFLKWQRILYTADNEFIKQTCNVAKF